MAMDHIQQYHVTSTCPKAYGGKLVDSLTECKAFEQSLGSAPVSDSATWRIRHNKHASARTTPRTDELLNFTELPSPRCGRQCQWSQRTWYCTAPCRRAKHHWGAHDCLWHENRPKRPPPTRPVLSVFSTQTGPTMASCSSACRTPTTVAHDAPQLSAPVSDRAPEVQRPETLQVPYSTVEAGVDEGALVSDALIRDLASEEEVTLGEALFRAGQTRAPGTEGLSAAYLAHERALAAEQALSRRHAPLPEPDIELSWYGFLPRPERQAFPGSCPRSQPVPGKDAAGAGPSSGHRRRWRRGTLL